MPTDFDMATLDFEDRDADSLIDTVLDTYGADFRVACGFGLEDLVILHKIKHKGGKPMVFFIDTMRHFEHTYAAADAATAALGFDVTWLWPDPAQLRKLIARDGATGCVRDPEARRRCCEVRRLEPLSRALRGAQAWVVGARRDSCSHREKLQKLEVDKEHEWIPKIAPLADWTFAQVAAYVNEHRIPTSALFRKNYASVGCAPCTRPIRTGEPERAGRWAFEDPTERERGRHISGTW